jgi:AcrR family transcriptional regulator
MKMPLQPRSQATLERILGAAEQLLADRGLADLGVAEILERAHVSTGSFYARFDGRDALVRHLAERFWTRARAEWADRLDAGPPAPTPSALVGRFVHEAVRWHRTHWAELRGFVQYGLTHQESRVLKLAREFDGFLAGRLASLLLARPEALAHPRPTVAVEFGCLQVAGTLRTLVLIGWPKRDWVPLGDDAIAAELTRAYLGYLGIGYSR